MRRNPETIWRSAPGFLALARPGRDVLTVVGPAAALWSLLEPGTTLVQAVEGFALHHDVPAEVVLNDLEPLWGRLLAEGHIQ